MPFTLSHSAAALPFLRSKYFSATGMIIGTVAPDFEYFFRMNVQGIYGHTVWGVLYFDLPVALFLAFLFHGVVKKNLIDQLPVFFQARFRTVREFNFPAYFKGHVLIFIVSVIIGSATHIVWDGFTHQRQYFVQALPQIYEGRTIAFMGAKYPLWYVLQHVSTVTGLLLIALYIFFIVKPAEGEFNKPRISYWILLAVIIAVVTYARLQFQLNNLKYVVAVITMCSAFCIGITILGLIPFKWQRSSPSGSK